MGLRLKDGNKAQCTTHNIANKGFSGMRSFVARFKVSCTLIGKKPAIPYWPYCKTLPFIKIHMINLQSLIILFVLTFSSLANAQPSKNDLVVNLKFAKGIRDAVKTEGRLFIFLSQNPEVEPRTQLAPFPWSIAHIFARNFSDISIQNGIQLDESTTWTKTPEWSLQSIPDNEYYIQALWDQNNSESQINVPGNLHSTKQKIVLNGKTEIKIIIDQIIPEREQIADELTRFIDFESDTLSKWWNKPMTLKASVLLPSGYNSNSEYAIRYNVAGYGGRYDRINKLLNDEKFMDWWKSDDSPQVINVFLDGEGPFGDSYQMDSENSGPYGYALINELIPHIESKFRGTNKSSTRFVDGCSTGGWVSLGLQLFYPDEFNGVFSYSPDALEFENYQLINIYKDKNAFYNEFGYLRPVARFTDGEPMLSLKKFIAYENVLGSSGTYLNSGGQFSAHTALYSPKGKDDLPMPLFNPITGEIDSLVAEHWKKYDFKKYLSKNWETLGPKLHDKIYVWMGDMDHFYLNVATRKFAEFIESMENPKSDAEIEFSAMEGHCSQFSHRAVLEKIQERLNEIKKTNGNK